mgnify:CR=1 FL=1
MEQNTHFNTEVSRRYSKALFSISSKENSEQEIYNEVSNLLEIFKSNDLFFKRELNFLTILSACASIVAALFISRFFASIIFINSPIFLLEE